MSEHEHRWEFLRSEEDRHYYGTGRVREIVFHDVFFCRSCLFYQRVETRRDQKDVGS